MTASIEDDDPDFYDVEEYNGFIRVAEKRPYGWYRCFTEEEVVELLLKFPALLQEVNNRRINGDRQVG